MEFKTTQLDASRPFAEIEERIAHAKTYLKRLPTAQREALLNQVAAAVSPHRLPTMEGPAHMMTIQVEAWDGDAPADMPSPMLIRRSPRVARHIPWQWRLIVAGIRLTRILHKSAKRQMKQFNKLQRQMIRRVLPRQKAMRGARAR